MNEDKVRLFCAVSIWGVITALAALKMLGATQISWLWVMSPLWLSWLLVLAIVVIVVCVHFAADLIGYFDPDK